MERIEDFKWLEWAKELQFLSQSALAYCKDIYDRERFERVREISAEIMSAASGLSVEQVKGLFCNEVGYQTPKMDSRGVIIEDGKILLVQEADGLWSIPGGWIDVNQTVASNVVKEVCEEAGLEVEPMRLLALLDRNRHHEPPFPYNVCKVFVQCRVLGGEFRENHETISIGYFSIDNLPPLATEKCSREEIELCMRIAADANANVVIE